MFKKNFNKAIMVVLIIAIIGVSINVNMLNICAKNNNYKRTVTMKI